MLAKCFYLLAVLTTAVSFVFSDVTFYPQGTHIQFGDSNLKIRNLVPLKLDWPSTNISSTAEALSFSLDNPFSFDFTVQVFTFFFWMPSKMQVTLTGGAAYTKNGNGACDSQSLVREYCDIKARVVIRGIETNLKIVDVAIDICDVVESMFAPYGQQSFPAVTKGATDISRIIYFQKFAVLGGLSEVLHLPCSSKFVAKNVMEVSTGLVLPLFFDFDTSNNITSGAIDTVTTITNGIAKLLNVSIYNNLTDATTTIAYKGGNVTMTSLKNVLDQIMTKKARAALKVYVPAGASLVYDVVVNDLQCRFFNVICSIPASNGIQVMNSRFTGLGDFNSILGNALGKSIDEMMTNITFGAVKKTSILTGGRYYLPLI